MTTSPLTLASKLDRLFAFTTPAPNPSSDTTTSRSSSASASAGVDPQILTAARAGRTDSLDLEICDALCALFGVEPAYLRESGGRDIDIDQRLCLWTFARDRGLHHLAARCADLSRDDAGSDRRDHGRTDCLSLSVQRNRAVRSTAVA